MNDYRKEQLATLDAARENYENALKAYTASIARTHAKKDGERAPSFAFWAKHTAAIYTLISIYKTTAESIRKNAPQNAQKQPKNARKEHKARRTPQTAKTR